MKSSRVQNLYLKLLIQNILSHVSFVFVMTLGVLIKDSCSHKDWTQFVFLETHDGHGGFVEQQRDARAGGVSELPLVGEAARLRQPCAPCTRGSAADQGPAHSPGQAGRGEADGVRLHLA